MRQHQNRETWRERKNWSNKSEMKRSWRSLIKPSVLSSSLSHCNCTHCCVLAHTRTHTIRSVLNSSSENFRSLLVLCPESVRFRFILNFVFFLSSVLAFHSCYRNSSICLWALWQQIDRTASGRKSRRKGNRKENFRNFLSGSPIGSHGVKNSVAGKTKDKCFANDIGNGCRLSNAVPVKKWKER